MVKKENIAGSSNSLLQTAANKRLGAGRLALTAFRAGARPPVKRVRVKSGDSRVSDLTDSVEENVAPAVVHEIQVGDVEVDSSILAMSLNSSSSSVSDPRKKTTQSIGKAVKTTPQPKAFEVSTKSRASTPAVKKSMDLQDGISLIAPSPMTLDRVQVQKGQERNAPESREYKQQHEEEEFEKQQSELKRQKMELKKLQLRKLVEEEQGEGFEAQLKDFSTKHIANPVAAAAVKKKSLVKKIMNKIRPKSPKKQSEDQKKMVQADKGKPPRPMTVSEARLLARKAIDASKRKSQSSQPDPSTMINSQYLPPRFPVSEILTQAKEDSISDLDASVRRFPVNEIMMEGVEQTRDDETISTLGTPQVFEKINQMIDGTANQHDQRDTVPVTGHDVQLSGHQVVVVEGGPSGVQGMPFGSQGSAQQVSLLEMESANASGTGNDASRIRHRLGSALVDQMDSVSALSNHADATAATDDTGAIEVVMGKCNPTTLDAQKDPKTGQIVLKSVDPVNYALAAICAVPARAALGAPEATQKTSEQQNVNENSEQKGQSKAMPTVLQSSGQLSPVKEEARSPPLGLSPLSTGDPGKNEAGDPLSPTSKFTFAIDEAIRKVQGQMKKNESRDNIGNTENNSSTEGRDGSNSADVFNSSSSNSSAALGNSLSPIAEGNEPATPRGEARTEAKKMQSPEGQEVVLVPSGEDSIPDLEQESISGSKQNGQLLAPNPSSDFMSSFPPMGSQLFSKRKSKRDKVQDHGVIDLTEVESSSSFEEKDKQPFNRDDDASQTAVAGTQLSGHAAKVASSPKDNSAYQFDDLMDLAESKLAFSNDKSLVLSGTDSDDHYSEEGDLSPRRVIQGEHVESVGSDGTVPVVRGVEVKKSSKKTTTNQATPKASGAKKKKKPVATLDDQADPDRDTQDQDRPRTRAKKKRGSKIPTESSFEAFEDPDGEVVLCYEVNQNGLVQKTERGKNESKRKSSPLKKRSRKPTTGDMRTEKQVEGTVDKNSSKPHKSANTAFQSTSPKDRSPSANNFAGFFSDGLFDLLSGEESTVTNRVESSDTIGQVLSQNTTETARLDYNRTTSSDDDLAWLANKEVKRERGREPSQNAEADGKSDVIDSVFEYSEHVICGNEPMKIVVKPKKSAKRSKNMKDSEVEGQRRASPRRSETGSLDDDMSEIYTVESSTADVKESTAQKAGVMCGAVPLYLLYSMKSLTDGIDEGGGQTPDTPTREERYASSPRSSSSHKNSSSPRRGSSPNKNRKRSSPGKGKKFFSSELEEESKVLPTNGTKPEAKGASSDPFVKHGDPGTNSAERKAPVIETVELDGSDKDGIAETSPRQGETVKGRGSTTRKSEQPQNSKPSPKRSTQKLTPKPESMHMRKLVKPKSPKKTVEAKTQQGSTKNESQSNQPYRSPTAKQSWKANQGLSTLEENEAVPIVLTEIGDQNEIVQNDQLKKNSFSKEPQANQAQESIPIVLAEPSVPKHAATAPKADLTGVLLDNDDAYWDTLSTIASTRDRSSEQEKRPPKVFTKPGPIPNEITMTKKQDQGDENKQTSSGNQERVDLTNELLSGGRGDGKVRRLKDNWIRQTQNSDDEPREPKNNENPTNLPANKATNSSGLVELGVRTGNQLYDVEQSRPANPGMVSRYGSKSGDEWIHAPTSNTSSPSAAKTKTELHSETMLSSNHSRVASLIAKFEAASLEKEGAIIPPRPAGEANMFSMHSRRDQPEGSGHTFSSPPESKGVDTSIETGMSNGGARSVSWGYEEIFEPLEPGAELAMGQEQAQMLGTESAGSEGYHQVMRPYSASRDSMPSDMEIRKPWIGESQDGVNGHTPSRGVSWGFEETYEEIDPVYANQDPSLGPMAGAYDMRYHPRGTEESFLIDERGAGPGYASNQWETIPAAQSSGSDGYEPEQRPYTSTEDFRAGPSYGRDFHPASSNSSQSEGYEQNQRPYSSREFVAPRAGPIATAYGPENPTMHSSGSEGYEPEGHHHIATAFVAQNPTMQSSGSEGYKPVNRSHSAMTGNRPYSQDGNHSHLPTTYKDSPTGHSSGSDGMQPFRRSDSGQENKLIPTGNEAIAYGVENPTTHSGGSDGYEPVLRSYSAHDSNKLEEDVQRSSTGVTTKPVLLRSDNPTAHSGGSGGYKPEARSYSARDAPERTDGRTEVTQGTMMHSSGSEGLEPTQRTSSSQAPEEPIHATSDGLEAAGRALEESSSGSDSPYSLYEKLPDGNSQEEIGQDAGLSLHFEDSKPHPQYQGYSRSQEGRNGNGSSAIPNNEQGNDLTKEEEQNLISRTLELSRAILSSVNAKGSSMSDEDIARSLLSLEADQNQLSGDLVGSPRSTAGVGGAGGRSPGTDTGRTTGHRTAATNNNAERSTMSPPYSMSSMSQESPAGINSIFSRYDHLAQHLLQQNGQLKQVAQGSESNNVASDSEHTPDIVRKLDELRMQRDRALSQYGNSQTPQSWTRNFASSGSDPPASQNTVQSGDLRERNQLRRYSNYSPSSSRDDSEFSNNRRSKSADPPRRHDYHDAGDYDSISTASDSTKTTPSRKARELRRQLDAALLASKSIRQSQEKLGSELRSFKQRFYEKNNELEDQAFHAMENAG